MSKIKKSWITLISLMSALFLILGFAFSLPKISASANTYAPSTVFSSGTGGAVGASKLSTEDEPKTEYVQFTFSDDGNVYFRRDLALRWFAEETKVSGETTTKEVNKNYFSMQLAFLDVVFEEFTISFESGEENITKEAKAVNKLVFKPVVEASDDEPEQEDKLDEDLEEEPKEEEPKVYPAQIKVYVVNAAEEDNEDNAVILDAKQDIFITIDETDCEIGEFNVWIKNVEAPKQEENKDEDQKDENGAEGATLEEEATLVGKFTNIGGYFLDYRSSSSTTPNTPITFTAKILDADESQLVLMRSLNKQTFALNASGRVEDNAPAVLVLNEDLYAFKLGKKFSLSYEAIDVCDDNVTVSREYYMLKTEKDEDGNTVYFMPNEKEITEEGHEGEKYNYKNLNTYTYFLPTLENPDQEEYVSIRFKLDDDTDENDTYVLLSWYANEDAAETFTCSGYEEYDNEGSKDVHLVTGREFTFIKVNREDDGPYYKYLEPKKADTEDGENENVVTNQDAFNDAVRAYQREVNERAEATSAGTGAYIYLPSLRELIESKNAGYRNLKFSVYYYKPGSTSASSQVSLSYNALKLEVDKEGDYRFRVIAQDASSNAMKYYYEGELVTVTSTNVWDIEGIPEFTFHINYNGPTIEAPEEQSLGYRNDRYSFDKFDIIALTGYQTEYTLYRYDETNASAAGVSTPTYSDFVKNASDFFNQFSELDEAQEDKTQKILYEISTYQDDVTEDDEAKWNRTDNDYHWDPDSSLSFIPQLVGFYVLKLVVEDYNYPGETAVQYQVIEVRNPIDTIPGQSQWLQENVVSVVLFSISGLLAIVVVVLFLVKPSEKKLEEVDLEKLKGKKKNKK